MRVNLIQKPLQLPPPFNPSLLFRKIQNARRLPRLQFYSSDLDLPYTRFLVKYQRMSSVTYGETHFVKSFGSAPDFDEGRDDLAIPQMIMAEPASRPCHKCFPSNKNMIVTILV